MRSALHFVVAALREGHVEIGGEGLTALHELIPLEPEDLMLRERHRFPEFRAIGEMKDEPAFDIGVAGDLQQVPACKDLAGLRSQVQKAMHCAFGPAHRYQIRPGWTRKHSDGQCEHPAASHL